MTADEILDLLRCRHRGEFLVEECKMGSSWLGADRRLDAWALRNTWSPLTAEGYEIKVSRSDFLQDIRRGKWRTYLDACHRLWFVTPSRLVAAREVPEECGLLWATPAKLTTRKAAPRRQLPARLTSTMAYCLMSRSRPVRNMWDANGRPRVDRWREALLTRNGAHTMGHMCARRLGERLGELEAQVEKQAWRLRELGGAA